VRHADVIVSLHGAGLVNGVFARDGVMLVELHGGYGADDVIFRRLAQGRQGGYMKVRNLRREGERRMRRRV
jgi:capsular polysaccharide biosynthesis protein